jgi:hypothetical protein
MAFELRFGFEKTAGSDSVLLENRGSVRFSCRLAMKQNVLWILRTTA